MSLLPKPVYGMLDERYSEVFSDLPRAPRQWLSRLVCGVVEGGGCTEPALASAMQRLGLRSATGESLEVSIRRFLSDRRVGVGSAYAPLLREVLGRRPTGLAILIVDQTPLKARLVRLQVSLAYHGRAVALAWAVYSARTGLGPEVWLSLFERVLDEAKALLPEGWMVRTLLDRGFVSPRIWDAVLARGWHPVLRLQQSVRVRKSRESERPVGELLGKEPGLIAVVGEIFKKGGWRVGTVTALRRDGMEESWLLASDLPAGEQRALEYAVRMHIEESFRDDKRSGWQWEQSRVTDPERAERLLLVLHLATLWCLSAGAIAVLTARARQWVRLSRPAWSLFHIGWAWLRHALAQPELVPLHHSLNHVPTWRTQLHPTLTATND